MTLIVSDPVAIEREACAVLCEKIIDRYSLEMWTVAARACVIAIRARAITSVYEKNQLTSDT